MSKFEVIAIANQKGEVVGNLTIKEDGNVISNVNVTVDTSIEKAGIFTIYLRYLKDIYISVFLYKNS